MQPTECSYFIADANFFIEGNNIVQAPQQIYTTQDAINEVRDFRSKQRLEHIKLTHEVIVREPSRESFDAVVKCATDSGNVVLLSETDMRLIALALDFQPQDGSQQTQQKTTTPGFDEWITVDNFGKLEDLPVVLCTGDATMQCVSMILGIHVVSPTGQRVAEVKRWLMRCSACGAETMDASKEFCPECGQHELVRYALVMRAGVERELPLPKRFEPTPRGKRYAIPTNRGGKGQRPNLVLSEDMMNEARRKYSWTGGTRARDLSGTEGHAFFEPRKKARAAPVYGYGSMNPNVPNHLLGKKKKRNRH
ncbi:hypothetical protein TRFO_02070 [Tritrichomonas foetus]|uniref:RNA-binding protein NOB1 n=1 Tax=Tritrichomonas foetus TaxID=1144522 RepID=A0A1J4JF64_9EUKA|nr:hypothetical protein TRFO_02070 [Tritrichomonas foetus]|eukprot:OHS96935.1 hypothetical protein TRFO_02070 [Tritrichomonas foetus]